MSGDYRYFYDDSGAKAPNVPNLHYGPARPNSEPWQYDAETRQVMTRNAERSLLLDAQRARLAPTTEQLRDRVLAARPAGHRTP